MLAMRQAGAQRPTQRPHVADRGVSLGGRAVLVRRGVRATGLDAADGVFALATSSSYVFAADSEGSVFAGVYHEAAGGFTVNGISLWNGASCRALGQGIGNGACCGQVFALTVAPERGRVGGG